MDSSKRLQFKDRLGPAIPGFESDAAVDAQLRQDALQYASEIVDIFGKVNRDLLLVLKTNNYLRTIDMRLGSPGNSFYTINDVSW